MNIKLFLRSLKSADPLARRVAFFFYQILKHVHKGTIGTVYSILDGEYEFIEAKILEKSELLNKKIKEANLPEHIRIGAVVRKDKVIIPRSDFIFEKEDLVVLLAQREHLKEVEDIFSVSSI